MAEPSRTELLASMESFLQAHAPCAPQTTLDATAVFVHASAVAHGYDAPGPAAQWRSDRDRHAWSYAAHGHTVHVVVTRVAQRAAVLALIDDGPCCMLDVARPTYINATALPWRDSDDRAQLASLYMRMDEWQHLLDERVWAPLTAPGAPDKGATIPCRDAPQALVAPGVAPPADAPPVSAFPPRIGDADRDPWAASPDVFGGGLPLARPPRADGMIVGPDHPLWQSRRREDNAPWLPPMGAPPGARFDPVGPLAPMRRRGDPDWDEFAPPSSMFS